VNRTRLKEDQIAIELKRLDGWSRQGDEITKTRTFKDFVQAMEFVNAVARLAEEVNHHPDIDIRWNKVHLALSTLSADGLTPLDFFVASAIDTL
jgi:4a-hydroxytetrahydrobiopterin dehydratase